MSETKEIYFEPCDNGIKIMCRDNDPQCKQSKVMQSLNKFLEKHGFEHAKVSKDYWDGDLDFRVSHSCPLLENVRKYNCYNEDSVIKDAFNSWKSVIKYLEENYEKKKIKKPRTTK